MKTLKFLAGGAALVALLALSACNDEPDEARDAKLATVTSESSSFVADATGGSVSFTAEGGTVVLNVDCDADWEALNDSPDWLSANASVSAGTLTLVAGQSTVASELTAQVVLQTAASGVKFATINVTQAAYGAPTVTVSETEYNFPAKGSLSKEFTVTANNDWKVSCEASWLSCTTSGSSFTVTASENETSESRSAEISVTCTDGVETASATVKVTQDAAAYINVTVESVEIDAEGGSASVSAESNFTVSASAADSWCSVSVSGSTVTVSASQNDDEARETTVTLTAGDGAENVATASFTVSQAVHVSWDPDAIVFEFVTTGADEEAVLPFSGTVAITVDWGDGSEAEEYSKSVSNPNSDFISHSYASAGTYDVAVTGTATTINTQSYASVHSSVYSTNLVAVRQWGSTGLTTLSLAYATALKELPAETGDALASVTSVSNMFKNSALESIPSDLFAKINATSLNSAFYGCESLKSIPEGLLAASESIRDVAYLFYGCSSLESIPSDLFSTCSLCTGFTYVFQNCTGLKSVPEGLFDAAGSTCTSFSNTFNGCTSLTTVPAGLFDAVFATTNMDFSSTFYNCSALTCESPYKEVTVNGSKVKVHLYERDDNSSSDEVGTTRAYTNCFAGSTFTDIDSIPSAWGGNK
ncbi:MAG: hypothetical protein LUC24_05910 [Bacteroidales bacterium]|nr:hypothetical protein [Bacteroidales bacterium]